LNLYILLHIDLKIIIIFQVILILINKHQIIHRITVIGRECNRGSWIQCSRIRSLRCLMSSQFQRYSL
jgi:hypothetical protein